MNDTLNVPDTSGFEVTPEQQQTLASWAVKDGLMTQAEADAMIAPAPVANSAPAADPSGIDARLAAIQYQPGQPHDFQLPPLAGPNEDYTDVHYQFDIKARGWLSAAKLDAGIGSAIASYAAETAPRWQAMSMQEQDLFTAGERATLERLGFTDERLATAKKFVHEVEGRYPGIVAYLEGTGAGSDARIVAQLLSSH